MTREEAIEKLEDISKNYMWACGEYSDALEMAISALQTEQRTGKWIPIGLVDANDNRNYECSECHHGDTHAKNQIVPYCWFCGAKMEEGELMEELDFTQPKKIVGKLISVEILDKIRDEIMSKDGLEEALEIIDKYKAESEDKE